MTLKPARVLLVEDNLGDARLVAEMLGGVTDPRFRLTHVERLDDALKRLDEGKYDVVLLDLELHDSSRLGTLMEIHSQTARVPIIILTGFDDKTVALWTSTEGALGYLVKDRLDADTLMYSIFDAMERHGKTSAQPSVVTKALTIFPFRQ
jgi:DNA-binding NtrC family response regulator